MYTNFATCSTDPPTFHITGAQSDSEVVSSQPANGSAGMAETTSSDRGYTSDSELYENLSRHGKNTVEMDVKPTKHGSWLLVSLFSVHCCHALH